MGSVEAMATLRRTQSKASFVAVAGRGDVSTKIGARGRKQGVGRESGGGPERGEDEASEKISSFEPSTTAGAPRPDGSRQWGLGSLLDLRTPSLVSWTVSRTESWLATLRCAGGAARREEP